MKSGKYIYYKPLDIRREKSLINDFHYEGQKMQVFDIITFFNDEQIGGVEPLASEFTNSFIYPEIYAAQIEDALIAPRPVGLSRYWPMLFRHKGEYCYINNLLSNHAKSLLEDQGWLHEHDSGLFFKDSEPEITLSGTYIWFFIFGNFDHFMREVLPSLILLKKSGLDLSKLKFLTSNAPNEVLELLSLFDIHESQLVQVTNKFVKIDKLIVPCFCTFGHIHTPTNMYIETSDFLRNKVIKKNNFKYKPPEKIFVSRRKAAQRKIANEAEIEKRFKKLGFAVIDPGELSKIEQIYFFSKAKIVVGAHGMGITNFSFAERPDLLLEIMPTDWNRVSYFRTAQLKGSAYGCYFIPPSQDGYQVDAKKIVKFYKNCRESLRMQ